MEKITINNLVIATFGNKEDYKLNKDTLPEGAITLVEDNSGSVNTNELTEKIDTLKTNINRDMSEFRGILDDLDNRLRAQKTNVSRDMSEFQGVLDDLDNRLRKQKTDLINLMTEKIEVAKAELTASLTKNAEEKES